jgi:hypothetical protein
MTAIGTINTVTPELFNYTPDEPDTITVSGAGWKTQFDLKAGVETSLIDRVTPQIRKQCKVGTTVFSVRSHNLGLLGEIELSIQK